MPASRLLGRPHASADPVPLPRAPKKVPQPQATRTASHDSADAARRRVCRACDRCRLKKSKCDGSSPCSRCGDDNTICIYGDRKQSHDKVYPAGYTGHLERDQVKLVSALQKMYKLLQNAQAWPGPALEERAGRPLTHDLLIALGVLTSKDDGAGDVEYFEEDYEKLKAKLLSDGAGYVQRRASSSSVSDRSHHDATQCTPVLEPVANDSRQPNFKDNFSFRSTSPSSFSQHLNQQRGQPFPAPQPSPLQHSSHYMNDPQFYAAEWSIPDMSTPQQTVHSNFATQTPGMQQAAMPQPHMQNYFTNEQQYDASMDWNNTTNFDGNAMSGGLPPQTSNVANSSEMDYSGFDPSEIEFHKYVQCNS